MFTVSQPPAPVLHELPGSSPSLSLWAPSVSQSKALCSTQPLSLSTQHTQLESPSGEPATSREFLKSSCSPFLTSARLFTQPNFPTSLETIQIRSNTAQFLPSPGVTWHLSFSASVHSPSGCIPPLCLPLHLYSPQRLPASRSFLVLGCPPCFCRGGS